MKSSIYILWLKNKQKKEAFFQVMGKRNQEKYGTIRGRKEMSYS